MGHSHLDLSALRAAPSPLVSPLCHAARACGGTATPLPGLPEAEHGAAGLLQALADLRGRLWGPHEGVLAWYDL